MTKSRRAFARVVQVSGKYPVVISIVILGLTLIVAAVPCVRWRVQRMRALASLENVAQVSHRSPRWARDVLGQKYSGLFAEKICVAFDWSKDHRVGDTRLLKRLGNLEYVSFDNWRLHGEVLEGIPDVDHIGTLSFRGAHFSPDALGVVASLRNVDSLDLDAADIDDSTVRQLTEIPCRSLCLSRTRITNRCLPAISRMERLESLDISYTRIGGAAFRHVARLDRLHVLNVEATDFNDVSAEWIADLKELRELDLGYTQITDSGVGNLAALPLLEQVSLIWTPVTPEGWSHVSSRLPACNVQFGEMTR